MIKSSKTSLKFANTGKLVNLHKFIEEYQRVFACFVDLLWERQDIPKLLPKSITEQIDTWLSARALQCAGKQASGIVRGTRRKQERRKYMIEKLHEQYRHRRANKLQKIYDSIKVSKPDISNVCPELDSRFVKIEFNSNTSFDCWITLSSIGNGIKLQIPVKKTKHLNKLRDAGEIRSGIRIGKESVTFMFDLPEPVMKQDGEVLGLDIGKENVYTCSDAQTSSKDKHGHDLASILTKMSRKQKGSRAFARCQNHRKNHVNWSINRIDLSKIKQANIEDIKHLRIGATSSRTLSHWTYTEIFSKLESYCYEHGVHVHKVNPTYTSQRCSACGWVRKSNRKGKQFKCGACGYTCDADLNAARNIALTLPPIGRQERLKQANRTGFYWYASGQECIASATQTS